MGLITRRALGSRPGCHIFLKHSFLSLLCIAESRMNQREPSTETEKPLENQSLENIRMMCYHSHIQAA